MIHGAIIVIFALIIGAMVNSYVSQLTEEQERRHRETIKAIETAAPPVVVVAPPPVAERRFGQRDVDEIIARIDRDLADRKESH